MEQNNYRKILITGCAGFIGNALLKKLSNETCYKIIGIDNLSSKHAKINVKNFLKYSNLEFVEGDFCNTDFLEEIFQKNKFEMLIHLGAKAGVRASFENPQDYVQTNVIGTLNILEMMKKYKVPKIIFSSSSSVYGNCCTESFSEDLMNLNPISPYAQTKKSCEELIKIYAEAYDISALCLRFFTVYGPGQREDLAIHKFTKAILEDKEIEIYGDGNTFRDYTYIDDVVRAVVLSIAYDKTNFEIINIGSSAPIKLNEMVKFLEKELGKSAKIKNVPMPLGDVNKTFSNSSKALKLLGFKPTIRFEEGIRLFVESMH